MKEYFESKTKKNIEKITDDVEAQLNIEEEVEMKIKSRTEVAGLEKVSVLSDIQENEIRAYRIALNEEDILAKTSSEISADFEGDVDEFYGNSMYTSDTIQNITEVMQSYLKDKKEMTIKVLTFTQSITVIEKPSTIISIVQRNLREDPRQLDGIVIPVFSNPTMKRNSTLDFQKYTREVGHWSCLFLDFRNNEICLLDSLGPSNAFMDHSVLGSFGQTIYNEIFGDDIIQTFKIIDSQRNLMIF